MARTLIYRYSDTEPPEPVGSFDLDRADSFAASPAPVRKSRDGRSVKKSAPQTLYRTDDGAWVRATRFDPPVGDIYEYVTDLAASSWLSSNGYAEVAESLADETPERRPGRPAIGGLIQVRLGELAEAVDDFARDQGVARSAAVRQLIEAGLTSSGYRQSR